MLKTPQFLYNIRFVARHSLVNMANLLGALGVLVIGVGEAIALPTFAISPPAETLYPAQVLRVLDGDTIAVQFISSPSGPAGIPSSNIVEIDIAQIDSPLEEQMHWSYFTGQYLQDTLNNKRVYLEVLPELDAETGRLSAYIWRSGVLINEEMLVNGYSLLEDIPSDNRYIDELVTAEEVAQRQGRGIWNYYSPLPATPAQYRQINGDS